MRILVLCKRQYTNKDLLDDRFGRLYELPEQLVQQGHEVQGICASYRRKVGGAYQPGTVKWRSLNALPFIHTSRYRSFITDVISDFAPDVLWASSDVWQVITALSIAKERNIPCIVDLYDNYESFGLTRLPFVRSAFRKACQEASALTIVTSTLKKYVMEHGEHQHHPIEVIGNAINPDEFFPREKLASRQALGIPEQGVLIGTAGALNQHRGIEVLFEAFLSLVDANPSIHLVVAGPRDRTVGRYQHPRILDLGVLPSSKIPLFWNALDLAIICNRDSDFGRYCYPQKYNEIRACQTPLLAARVGEVSILLENDENALFEPSSESDLANAIQNKLTNSHSTILDSVAPRTWVEMGRLLSNLVEAVR